MVTDQEHLVSTFSIHEELGIERSLIPVYGGIPLAQGMVQSSAECRLYDQDLLLNADFEALSHWEDGSIRWLFVCFTTDIDALATKTYHLYSLNPKQAPAHPPAKPMAICETPSRLSFDNGSMAFEFQKDRYRPFDIMSIHGQTIADNTGRSGLYLVDENDEYYDSVYSPATDVSIVENTHMRSVVEVKGTLRSKSGVSAGDYLVRYFIYRQVPTLTLDITYINTRRDSCFAIKRIGCMISMPHTGLVKSGHFSGVIDIDRACTVFVDRVQDASTLGKCCYIGDWPTDGTRRNDTAVQAVHPWAALDRDNTGLAVTVHKMVENYPKEMAYDGDRTLDIAFWDSTVKGCLNLTQGMAKTHRLFVHTYRGDHEAKQLHKTMLSFDDPMVIHPKNIVQTQVLGKFLPYSPKTYPRYEMYLRDVFHLWKASNMPLGFMDYGDSPQLGDDGRQDFMANNEHDFPLVMLMQYLRTGEKDYFTVAEAAIRHMTDIDMIHFSTHEDMIGHVRAHGPNHTLPAQDRPNVCNSHMWIDGILLYYHLTGDRRMLDLAKQIGHAFMSREEALTKGDPDREQAWTLIALVSLYETTRDAKVYDVCQNIARFVMEWQDKNGKLERTFGFRKCFSILHEGLLTVGLYRFLEICKDESEKQRLKDAITRIIDTVIEHGMYEDGGFIYLDYPGYRFNRCGGDIQEAFGYAYAVSGDTKYIRIANRDLYRTHEVIHALLSPFGAKVSDSHHLVTAFNHAIAANWRGLFRYMYHADQSGLGRDILTF